MKTLSKIYMWVIFALLYAPILVLILFSFNEAGSLNNFSSFSLKWYAELFRDTRALQALKNSLYLAVSSSLLATVIGTLAAFGLSRMRSKYMKAALKSVTNIPMMNPDIVTGVSMMLLFVAAMAIPFSPIKKLGFVTMLIAHTTFNLPYVILSVLPRFQQMDKHLTEAALDLGCTPTMTFFRVELPLVIPGIISGLMLGFTLSLDDFVISHFVSSPDFQTLPLYVYNQTAHEVKYSMYALCALLVFVILLLLLAVNFAGAKDVKKAERPRRSHKRTGGAA
ncbi:MAG: ABC transporter permease [Clostridia bacterium]|nr:ABC transporter permease [Clostridia bacterium]